MRLIDADALRDALQYEIDKAIPPFDDIVGAIRCGVRLSRNIAEDQPTVDAVPVRHGKWIYGNDFYWYTASCSECGYQRRTDIKAEGWNQWKFCPMCGSRMDEK